MPFTFHQVDIIAFDAHIAIKPLAFPQLLKPEFRFLADEEKYDDHYESWQAIETNDFTVRPIKKREFSRNHFWKNYAAMSFSTYRDYWGLQIPFIFEPKNLDLKANTEGFIFQVELEPVVYLNSMGWSANVKTRLTGDIQSGQLQEFVGRLRGFDKNKLPFVAAGKNQSLTSVFKLLGGMVRDGIYISPDDVGDIISVSNQLIISLAHSTSPPKYFKEEWGLTPTMADDERAEMLSILYGRKIEGDAKILVTRFRDTNFSLTHFDLGTLLYMQEEALEPAAKTEALDCLASNVRSCTMVSLVMLDFDRAASKSRQAHPVLKALQPQVNATLAALPDSYNNAYCQNFYRHHKRLKKFFGAEETEEEVVEE